MQGPRKYNSNVQGPETNQDKRMCIKGHAVVVVPRSCDTVAVDPLQSVLKERFYPFKGRPCELVRYLWHTTVS